MVSQKNQILTFLANNPDQEYDNDEIWKQVFNKKINHSTVRGRLSELNTANLVNSEKKIKTDENNNIRNKTWYSTLQMFKKIAKLGASCSGKFRRLYAFTFDSNEDDVSEQLIDKIFDEFPNCDIFEYKEKMDINKTGEKKKEITFGYEIEEWSKKVPFVWDLIEFGEEGVEKNRSKA